MRLRLNGETYPEDENGRDFYLFPNKRRVDDESRGGVTVDEVGPDETEIQKSGHFPTDALKGTLSPSPSEHEQAHDELNPNTPQDLTPLDPSRVFGHQKSGENEGYETSGRNEASGLVSGVKIKEGSQAGEYGQHQYQFHVPKMIKPGNQEAK